jgi:hypothetical protein
MARILAGLAKAWVLVTINFMRLQHNIAEASLSLLPRVPEVEQRAVPFYVAMHH